MAHSTLPCAVHRACTVTPSSRGVGGGDPDVESEQTVAKGARQYVRRTEPCARNQARRFQLGAGVTCAGGTVGAVSDGVVSSGGLGSAAAEGVRAGVVQQGSAA